MEIDSSVSDDDLMLKWAAECYEEWRTTDDFRLLEEPLRYAEFWIHNHSTAGDHASTPWLLLLSRLLTTPWQVNLSTISSISRAISINASLVLEHQHDNTEIANCSKIMLAEIFTDQYSSHPDAVKLKKALALLQECAHLPLHSPTSPARTALRLLDMIVGRWPDTVLDLISTASPENGSELVIVSGLTTRLTRDFGWLEKISEAYYSGYRNRSHLPSLRKSITRLSQYSSDHSLSKVDESRLSVRLADLQCTLWMATQDPTDLATAVTVVNQALLTSTENSQDRLMSTACFAIVANAWYLQTESEDERNNILEKCKTALSQSWQNENLVNIWCITLMKLLRIKFSRTNDVTILKEAVGYGRKAFQDYARRLLSPPDGDLKDEDATQSKPTNALPDSDLPDQSGDLSFYLGSLLHDLYHETLDPYLLKEAELYSELAMNNSPSPDSTEVFSHQRFNTLILLYEVTISQSYLEKAKLLAMARLNYFGTSTKRRKWLYFLGDAVNQEHLHSMRPEPLNESIRLFREALEIETPDDQEGAEMTLSLRHGLADSLFRRADLNLNESDSLHDINEALENINLEMNSLPPAEIWAKDLKHSIYGLRGQIYFLRFQRSGLRDDLDFAISDIKECKNLMNEESVYQNEANYSLGMAFLRSDREEQRRQGVNCFLDIWATSSTNIITRLLTAVQLSRHYVEMKDWQNASLMMDHAMDLLPVIQNPLQVLRDVEGIARRFSHLVGVAFALTLQAEGDATRALEQLERNRGSVLAYLLNESDDIADLKSKYEQDATVYLEIRDILKRRGSRPKLQSMQVETEIAALKQFDKAAVAMQELLRKIRSRHGFGRFLLGPDQAQICRAMSTGYIVIVNTTNIRSDAIIISSSGVQHLKLQSLIFDDAAEWLKKDITEYERPQFRKKNIMFRSFLAWLWKVCVREILSMISRHHDSTEELPRVWWMGIGLCAYFPFHAAGIHDGVSKEYTLASVVSSYIPTLRSFINAKQQAEYHGIPAEQPSMLMVKMQHTPGKNDLPGVADEETIIKGYKGSKLQYSVISQRTSEEVLEAIEDHDIVHFACHGISNDNENGLESSLVFQKEHQNTREVLPDKLYVQQIYNKRLKRARLAYLSACSTAQLADARLVDEGVHLVSSFMIAGFTHVIGTRWMTLDDVCVQMTGCFYREYFNLRESGVHSDEVALALHRATVGIRNERPRQPLGWAPFVHYGI